MATATMTATATHTATKVHFHPFKIKNVTAAKSSYQLPVALPGMHPPKIVVVPAHTLPYQPWWEALHVTINQSFKLKTHDVFPQSWSRLPARPKEAALQLKQELGPDGVLAVVFLVDRPIACAGAFPHVGLEWMETESTTYRPRKRSRHDSKVDDQKSATPIENNHHKEYEPVTTVPRLNRLPQTPQRGTDWELCCVCVHPIHRRIGLSPKLLRTLVDHIYKLGARRVISTYAIDETGYYWPNLGFEVVEGAGGLLKKGLMHPEGGDPLQHDVRLALAIKTI